MSVSLWDWWENVLTDVQRDRLMAESGRPLPPDLALELWRGSGLLHVVEPEAWSVDSDERAHAWRLTVEVADFVAAREYERRHPERS